MATQLEQATAFTRLHVPGDPVLLFNIWDAGSAKVVAACGAKALATGSWSVAAAHGYEDGEALPLDLALANCQRIVAAVELPVSLDLESGYGREPGAVGETVSRAIAAGAVGCNLEDQIIGGEGMYAIDAQATRIGAAHRAADDAGIPVFINARTDVFLLAEPSAHDRRLLEQTMQRAIAYCDAGASGIFVPGLVDEALIEDFCRSCPVPVNVMSLDAQPQVQRLAALGVARISAGPAPYRLVMKALEAAARAAYS
ncbi:MAG TPA: isocitrate lyase/phosphoenolpyruvate mutase family protein [Gammaproteobacteria bacterium]|nr:isocitrate lyase/phosphoenolpyruvate mutase family protein [Gammaproteobacteria bacterium]